MALINSTTPKTTAGPILTNPNNSTTDEDNAIALYYLSYFIVLAAFSCLLGGLWMMYSHRAPCGAIYREDIEQAYERGRTDGRREAVAKEE